MSQPWYSQNHHRSYPLRENTDAVFGGKLLPSTAIADLQVMEMLHPDPVVTLTRLTAGDSGVDFVFQVAGSAGSYSRTVPVPAMAPEGYVAVSADAAGQVRLTVGPGMAELAAWDAGNHDGSAEVEPATVSSHAELVLASLQGSGDSVPVSGDIILEDGFNMRIRAAGGRIRFDAIPGAGRGYPCIYTGTEGDLDCTEFVQFINDAPAGPDGKLNLEGGRGLSVINLPDEHTIVLEIDGDTERRNCT